MAERGLSRGETKKTEKAEEREIEKAGERKREFELEYEIVK